MAAATEFRDRAEPGLVLQFPLGQPLDDVDERLRHQAFQLAEGIPLERGTDVSLFAGLDSHTKCNTICTLVP